MRKAWSVFIACGALMFSTHARADKPDAADELFREGRKAAVDGNFDVACEKFDASLKLEPATGTLLNLADCEEARGQFARAWRDFISVADSLSDSDERKKIALERARRLEQSMPHLRIRVSRGSTGVRVWRDQVELGDAAIGLALPVDPGPHVVVVKEVGRRDHAYELYVAHEGERDVEVAHGPRSGERIAAYILGTAGILSVAAGATTGVFALTRLSMSNDACTGNVCTSQTAVDHYRQAQSFALATDIAFAAGAALLVTSIVLLLLPNHVTRTSLGAGVSF